MTFANPHAAVVGAICAAFGCDPTQKPIAAEPVVAARVAQPVPAGAPWIVDRPGADVGNPLVTASLLGVATVESSARPSPLLISCRADAGGAGLGAKFGVHRSLGFDTDPFEGPGAVGGSRRLLSISWPDGATESHFVAGYWSADWPDTFVFEGPSSPAGAKASAALASQLAASAGHDVVFSVPDAQGDGPPVTARFRLPADTAALRAAIQPCL